MCTKFNFNEGVVFIASFLLGRSVLIDEIIKQVQSFLVGIVLLDHLLLHRLLELLLLLHLLLRELLLLLVLQWDLLLSLLVLLSFNFEVQILLILTVLRVLMLFVHRIELPIGHVLLKLHLLRLLNLKLLLLSLIELVRIFEKSRRSDVICRFKKVTLEGFILLSYLVFELFLCQFGLPVDCFCENSGCNYRLG